MVFNQKLYLSNGNSFNTTSLILILKKKASDYKDHSLTQCFQGYHFKNVKKLFSLCLLEVKNPMYLITSRSHKQPQQVNQQFLNVLLFQISTIIITTIKIYVIFTLQLWTLNTYYPYSKDT